MRLIVDIILPTSISIRMYTILFPLWLLIPSPSPPRSRVSFLRRLRCFNVRSQYPVRAGDPSWCQRWPVEGPEVPVAYQGGTSSSGATEIC